MLFSALWKNQCWICHRIRCITKFFTEFGAEKCTFSFTGGYSAHTSFNALLTCQKVSLKNIFPTSKISRMISLVPKKDLSVPTICCLAKNRSFSICQFIFFIIKQSHQNYRGHFWLKEERNQKLSWARAPSRLPPNCHVCSLSLLLYYNRFVCHH